MRATRWELIVNGNDAVEYLLEPANEMDKCVVQTAQPQTADQQMGQGNKFTSSGAQMLWEQTTMSAKSAARWR